MTATTENPIEDLEALLRRYVSLPDQRVWLPISLYNFQDESVAVAVSPHSANQATITDEGQTIASVEDLGLEFDEDSALARDIQTIAARRGFEFDGYAFRRLVTAEEIPTAALHLAEVEIAVSALLQLRLLTPETNIFATHARQILQEQLRPRVAQHVRFGHEYAGKYKDGEFFCVAEVKKPVGVKLVTNSNNMKDAVIAGLMFEGESIELAALKKPRRKLGGPRVVQFATLFADHIYTNPEKLAKYLNDRVA